MARKQTCGVSRCLRLAEKLVITVITVITLYKIVATSDLSVKFKSCHIFNISWLVVGPPLWKIWVRQLGWLATQYFWENKIDGNQTTNQICMEVSWNRGTPSHHPFEGFYHLQHLILTYLFQSPYFWDGRKPPGHHLVAATEKAHPQVWKPGFPHIHTLSLLLLMMV